ncbi:MAG: TonB-dependent receptor plug domain-containing protein [Opitutaceae bacterium]
MPSPFSSRCRLRHRRNIGEFMKYLPGVTVDYVAADVRTVSVRGFADNFTSVWVNGARVASAASGSNTRAFEFEQVSINNIARIEFIEVADPEHAGGLARRRRQHDQQERIRARSGRAALSSVSQRQVQVRSGLSPRTESRGRHAQANA